MAAPAGDSGAPAAVSDAKSSDDAASAGTAAGSSGVTVASLQLKMSKMERLYTLTKKRLEDSQRALAAKDATIAQLTGDTDRSHGYLSLNDLDSARWHVAQCMQADHSQQLWCLCVEESDRDGGDAGGAGGGDGGADADAAALLGDDEGEPPRSGWFLQEDVRDRVGDDELPPLAPTAAEYDAAMSAAEAARDELQVFKEEYRKYRIKSEMLLRQREADLASAKDRSLSLQQSRMSGADMQAELDALKAQVATLTKARQDQAEADMRMRETVRELQSDLKAAQAQADSWRSRHETVVREATEAARRARDDRAADAAAGGGDGSGGDGGDGGMDAAAAAKLTLQHTQLRKEYASYRKRAMELIKDKDADIAKWKAKALAANERERERERGSAAAGGGGGDAAGDGGGSGSGSEDHPRSPIPRDASIASGVALGRTASNGGASVGMGMGMRRDSSVGSGLSWALTAGGGHFAHGHGAADGEDYAARHEYLKNVVLRYMTTADMAVKVQLEAAVAAVLEMTPSEVERIQAARQAQSGIADSIWTKASSWFGGASAPAAPAGGGLPPHAPAGGAGAVVLTPPKP